MHWKSITAVLALWSATAQAQVTLHGSGTTNPSKCYWQIIDKFTTQSKIPIRMTYRAVGSSIGQAEFMELPLAVNDFSSGDLPLTQEYYSTLTAAGVGMMHFPIFIGTVSFFHSVPGVQDLNLTGEILAKIYMFEITNWDHEEIKAINPDMQLSGNTTIKVARRAEGSSSTNTATEYMYAAAPDIYDASLVGAFPTWPNTTFDENVLTCSGSGGMTACVEDYENALAYIETGHGVDAGIPEVRIENLDGRYLTAQESVENGGLSQEEQVDLFPSEATGDFSEVSFINRPGEYSWPMVLLTYLYVRTDLSYLDADQQGLLLAFLDAMYMPDYIQSCADEYGFLLPTEDMKAYSLTAIEELRALNSNATPWTFEGSDTLAVKGMNDYVISVKRKSALDDLHDQLEDITTSEGSAPDGSTQAEMDQMMAAMADMQNQMEEMSRGMEEMNNLMASLEGGDGASIVTQGSFTEDDEKKVQVALGMASTSFVLSVLIVLVSMFRFATKP